MQTQREVMAFQIECQRKYHESHGEPIAPATERALMDIAGVITSNAVLATRQRISKLEDMLNF